MYRSFPKKSFYKKIYIFGERNDLPATLNQNSLRSPS